MSFSLRERHVLRLLQEQYEPQGYTFLPYPPADILPAAVGEYRPDAVALREGDNIAIEVLDRQQSHAALASVAERFRDIDGWSFTIVYTPQYESEHFQDDIPGEYRERLLEIEKIVEIGANDAALLLSWAVLEAAGRQLRKRHSADASYDMSPSQLVQMLVMEGLISQGDGDELRRLAKTRNAIAHGYNGRASRRDVDEIVRNIVRLNHKLLHE